MTWCLQEAEYIYYRYYECKYGTHKILFSYPTCITNIPEFLHAIILWISPWYETPYIKIFWKKFQKHDYRRIPILYNLLLILKSGILLFMKEVPNTGLRTNTYFVVYISDTKHLKYEFSLKLQVLGYTYISVYCSICQEGKTLLYQTPFLDWVSDFSV